MRQCAYNNTLGGLSRIIHKDSHFSVEITSWAEIREASQRLKMFAATVPLRALSLDIKNLEVGGYIDEDDSSSDSDDSSTSGYSNVTSTPCLQLHEHAEHTPCSIGIDSFSMAPETFEPGWFKRALSVLTIPSTSPFSSNPTLRSLALSISSWQFMDSTVEGSPWSWTARFFTSIPDSVAARIENVQVNLHVGFPYTICELSNYLMRGLPHDDAWTVWDQELSGTWKNMIDKKDGERWSNLKKVSITAYAVNVCSVGPETEGEWKGATRIIQQEMLPELNAKGILDVHCVMLEGY